MSDIATTTAIPVYRLDRFAVPAAARAEFLDRVRQTHDLLRRQPGFLHDLILEQPGAEGETNLATLVAWRSEAALAPARDAVAALHRAQDFEPRSLMARLGIRAEFGLYRPAGS